MTKRKAISKGLRFDIFKRDGFTCQYCGSHPPDAVLEIDHIMPVSKGGDNDAMNLVSACGGCNRGKSAKLLDNPQRPDADLVWLETQQEIAELRRYQEAVQKRLEVTEQIAESLADVWQSFTCYDWAPSEHIIKGWMAKYDPEIIEEAIKVTSVKMRSGTLYGFQIDGSGSSWQKWMWGVMRNKAEQR